MGASRHEQELAQTSGVSIRHWAKPAKILMDDRVTGMEFEGTELSKDGSLIGTGETWSLNADVIFRAVGQSLSTDIFGTTANGFEHNRGKLTVDNNRRTTVAAIWAGGDCIDGKDDLTVTAVQDGKVAAIDIDNYLRSSEQGGDQWQT
jgi:glutamate synthase (NADPH/NADH) small chain